MKYNFNFTEEELVQLKKNFHIHPRTTADELLKNVLKKSFEEITDPLFFKYIFYSNKEIRDLASKIINSIVKSSCPFTVIHGYSKNGKSTFVKYLQHIYDSDNASFGDRIYLERFNFEKYEDAEDYCKKMQSFFKELFNFDDINELEKDINKMNDFILFYKSFLNALKNEIRKDKNGNERGEYTNTIYSFLKSFFNPFLKDLAQFTSDSLISFNGKKNGYCVTNIEDNLDKLLDKIEQSKSGHLIPFIVLYKIFLLKQEIISKDKKRRLLFIFDNLDDYFSHKDLSFFDQPQSQLAIFIEKFGNTVSHIFSESLSQSCGCDSENCFSFDTDVKFLFVFRTANLFVYSNFVNEKKALEPQPLERKFPICLLQREFFRYFTVNFTNKIIEKRILFFEALAKRCNIKFIDSKNYYFIKYLSGAFLSKEGDLTRGSNKSIFSIWNGDMKELWQAITHNWDVFEKSYFEKSGIIKYASNKKFFSKQFILKGLYIYFFFDLLTTIDTEDKPNGFLKCLYSYKRIPQFPEKNVRRFIINYIINESEKKPRPESLRDIENKGVGLKDLLDELSKVTPTNNPAIQEAIKSFFIDTCSNKIDFFTHMFTIYKSQKKIINEEEVGSIYYDIAKDINSYFSKGVTDKVQLNKIRLFNNDNILFFASYLNSHFEMDSFYLSHSEVDEKYKLDIKKPLLLSIEKINKKRDDNDLENYEFYQIIGKVYDYVKLTSENMVKYYTQNLQYKYPVEKFTKNPLFSVHDKSQGKGGDFLFRLMITRHITYLESFRRGIIQNILVKKISKELKLEISKYIVKTIKQYVELYQRLYLDIINNNQNNLIDEQHILSHTNGRMTEYITKANQILDSEEPDFETILKIVEEKKKEKKERVKNTSR